MGKTTREGRKSYTTRNMRVDLLNRVKMIALRTDSSTEEVLNRVVEVGLPLLVELLKEEDVAAVTAAKSFDEILKEGANDDDTIHEAIA